MKTWEDTKKLLDKNLECEIDRLARLGCNVYDQRKGRKRTIKKL